MNARTFAKDGSFVIVTRTRAEQIGRVAPCCKRPHLRGGFVVGDSHAECMLHARQYDAATCLIVERERERGERTELLTAPESPAFGPRRDHR